MTSRLIWLSSSLERWETREPVTGFQSGHPASILQACMVCRCGHREYTTGVDRGGQPPNGGAKKNFFVKIEGLSTIKLGPRPPSS